ncbi:MAG TPA: helix-turn-helix transcriptional regulator [Bryobacteraceae bacterium]|nr:helix-turn-helix transcriptional regulator [Bryobacteraceae bacterium]
MRESSETIAALMAKRKVSRAELARRLGKSQTWVTQLLSGKANLTIGTLAEAARVLDAGITLKATTHSAKPTSPKPAMPSLPPGSIEMRA